MVYMEQAQPEQTPAVQLAQTASHTELDLAALAQPGPTLQVEILTFTHFQNFTLGFFRPSLFSIDGWFALSWQSAPLPGKNTDF